MFRVIQKLESTLFIATSKETLNNSMHYLDHTTIFTKDNFPLENQQFFGRNLVFAI
jgi:hypothetical protein